MKTNFKKIQSPDNKETLEKPDLETEKELSQEEFEQYVTDLGTKGSFMIYRDAKSKKDELGIEELSEEILSSYKQSNQYHNNF